MKSRNNSIMKNTTLPQAFCWTRMGHEAGQGLHGIIARKDAERELGNGIFFWGIGNSLGNRLWEFINATQRPTVLFSPMKAKPRPTDVAPSKIFVWTSYLDRHGNKHRMPDHVLITSRGTTTTATKTRHYALVCKRTKPLHASQRMSIIRDALRNFGQKSKIGFSQVTAIVETTATHPSTGLSYEVSFAAELVPPYHVRLADPVEIPTKVITKVNTFWSNQDCKISDWNILFQEEIKKNLKSQEYSCQPDLPFKGQRTKQRR